MVYKRITSNIMFIKILFILIIFSILHLTITPRILLSRLNLIALIWSIIILIYNSIFLILYNKEINFQIFINYK